ncbi:MAG: PAS domain S-box protein [Bacteroidota bacterium]
MPLSTPPDAPDAPDGRDAATRLVDRWIGPLDASGDPVRWRHARVVVVVAAGALLAFAALGVGLLFGRSPAPPQLIVAGAAALTLLALVLVRWGGKVEAAAWLVALTVVAVPLLEAATDAGTRDPALALIAFAPIVGAMMSGPRLAVVTAVVGVLGAAAIYVLDLRGLLPAPYSSPGALSVYAVSMAAGAAALSALAGAFYARHTRAALGVAEDQRSRLDEALRESEARYRTLVEDLPLGVYRTALDGRILLANRALARMVGAADPEAATDLNAADFYADPTERDRFRAAVDRSGSVRRFETRWRRPDGQIRYVRVDAHATRDDDGAVLHYEGIVEDVTAEREAREALHRSEARFRALVQRSTDVTAVADRDGALTYISPSVDDLLGELASTLLGADLFARIHEDDREAVQAFVDELRTGGAPAHIEVRLRHAEGHYVYVEAVGAALYEDAVVGGLVLNLRDVTERKRAQAVLLQAKQQAEEVAAVKTTFLANMSHEIRTPLTAILGFADVLGDEVEDPAQKEFVELISRSGQRLMDTLNSVLDLARLEAGHGELAEARVDLGAVVAETVAMFQPAASDRGLTIRGDVAPGGLDALLDEAALARVLHNLIGNALKFTKTGEVVVAARPDPEGVQGPAVVLEVRDTGIGMDVDFLPRLFGEFEQESTGVGRTHEGAGLGLAISHQLVRRMGGTIHVESEKGVGTTFAVAFPAADLAPEGPDRRLLALVVDDNEHARQVAERTLAEQYRVITAVDGDSALAVFESQTPDAVFLDIHLGQSITGEDVMRRLRMMPASADLPIVAVTAYALPGDRERFLAAGFDGYVTKPYSREHLLRSMEEAIQARAEAAAQAMASVPEVLEEVTAFDLDLPASEERPPVPVSPSPTAFVVRAERPSVPEAEPVDATAPEASPEAEPIDAPAPETSPEAVREPISETPPEAVAEQTPPEPTAPPEPAPAEFVRIDFPWRSEDA